MYPECGERTNCVGAAILYQRPWDDLQTAGHSLVRPLMYVCDTLGTFVQDLTGEIRADINLNLNGNSKTCTVRSDMTEHTHRNPCKYSFDVNIRPILTGGNAASIIRRVTDLTSFVVPFIPQSSPEPWPSRRRRRLGPDGRPL